MQELSSKQAIVGAIGRQAIGGRAISRRAIDRLVDGEARCESLAEVGGRFGRKKSCALSEGYDPTTTCMPVYLLVIEEEWQTPESVRSLNGVFVFVYEGTVP